MLILKIQINYRTIKTIGIHNIWPKVMPSDFKGNCRYNVYDFGDFLIDTEHNKPIGKISHKRSDGAEILALKALKLVIKHNKIKPQ